MSSSGLIYAVIVGAWAAYLVPMWLRRQDELNEARPTERFSTAIRLLSGRAAMERRVAKARGETVEPEADEDGDEDDAELDASVDVRGLAVPATEVRPAVQRPAARPVHGPQNPRAKVMARRRRTTTTLFVAFTLGTVAVAVGGIGLLWAPAIPAVLLTLYIGQMRRQERRRFEVRLDQRQAAEAARRLRARHRPPEQQEHDERPRHAAGPSASGHAHGPSHGHSAAHGHGSAHGQGHARPSAHAAQALSQPHEEPPPSPRTADRRALVEQTDHAEWVDQQRSQQTADDGWDPVPVPLPTYVTAPVAPRTSGGIDLGAPGTWSSARSGTTPAEPPTPSRDAGESRDPQQPARRPRSSRTPLFDQYADPDRPRAANE